MCIRDSYYKVFNDDWEFTDLTPKELIGHGHYSGKNGIVYPDLTGYTTALEILKRAVVVVDP